MFSLLSLLMLQSAGNATCGRSKFKAGRSNARRKDTKNAKGIEMMTCTHGVIKGMASLAHAETYKHTHLQQLKSVESGATFFCNDVVCKFKPFCEKIALMFPERKDFQRAAIAQKWFLSRFHGRAHSWDCRVKYCNIFRVIFN